MRTSVNANSRLLTTGQRPVAASAAAPMLPRAISSARRVRTADAVVLFDDGGRFVGVVKHPEGPPTFGPSAATVLLGRSR